MNGQICRDFIETRHCNNSTCSLIHDKNICKFQFLYGDCQKGDSCNFKHNVGDAPLTGKSSNRVVNTREELNSTGKTQVLNRRPRNKRKKNTESFKPSHDLPDMRLLISTAKDKLDFVSSWRDVIIVPDLYVDVANSLDGGGTMYDGLINEMNTYRTHNNVKDETLWKLWHGDTHYIADDKVKWKPQCPLFNIVIKKMETFFDMDIQATRFNWYKDSSEWKPYHHDAAAVKEDKALTQNITIGVSFGETRDVAFQHAKTRTTLSIPLKDGYIYTFGKDVNIEWRHGIPQVKEFNDKGRISIIAWGKVAVVEGV